MIIDTYKNTRHIQKHRQLWYINDFDNISITNKSNVIRTVTKLQQYLNDDGKNHEHDHDQDGYDGSGDGYEDDEYGDDKNNNYNSSSSSNNY